MDKFAQRRGFFSKMREKANITGKILESLNPEFREMMEKIREADEKVRDNAEGVKEIVTNSLSLFRRRDYLGSATQISTFHERCRHIVLILENLKKHVNLKHYEFILDQFEDTAKEQLFGYNPQKEIKLESKEKINVLKKDAGLLSDVAHNIFSEKGQAMRALEKRVSLPFLKALRSDTSSMVGYSQGMQKLLFDTLRYLAHSVATRNVDEYIKRSDEFIKRFKRFHDNYVKYYEKNITPLKQHYNEIQQKNKEKQNQEQVKRDLEEKAKQDQAEQERIQKVKDQFRQKQEELARREEYGQKSQQEKEQLYRDLELQKQRSLQQEQIPEEPEFEAQRALEKLHEKHGPSDVKEVHPEAQKTLQTLEQNLGAEEGEQEDPFELQKKQELISKLTKCANENNIKEMVNLLIFASDKNIGLLALAEGVINEYKFAAEGDDESDSFLLGKKKVNITHDLMFGRIDRSYDSFESLRNITPDNIRSSPGTEEHITLLFLKRLHELNIDISEFETDVRFKLVTLIKNAVIHGWVIAGHQVTDTHNPDDIVLEILVKFTLKQLNLPETAKMRVFCRYSVSNRTLTLKTIQKNFMAN